MHEHRRRFSCACNPGYFGDGLTCTNASEHFQGYEVDTGKSTKLPTKPVVDLVDEVGSQANVTVEDRPDYLFTPANKNNEGLFNSADHLACYKIRGLKANRNVTIDNQFGSQTLKLKDGKLLCVPSAKTLVPPPPVKPANPGAEHFQCYEVDKAQVDADADHTRGQARGPIRDVDRRGRGGPARFLLQPHGQE